MQRACLYLCLARSQQRKEVCATTTENERANNEGGSRKKKSKRRQRIRYARLFSLTLAPLEAFEKTVSARRRQPNHFFPQQIVAAFAFLVTRAYVYIRALFFYSCPPCFFDACRVHVCHGLETKLHLREITFLCRGCGVFLLSGLAKCVAINIPMLGASVCLTARGKYLNLEGYKSWFAVMRCCCLQAI